MSADPSSTFSTFVSTSTVTSFVHSATGQSLPTVTLSSNSPTSQPDQVVILLRTEVRVHHYSQWYSGPIALFYPQYTSLDDGSLLTDVYLEHVYVANISLLINTALLIFFFRSTIVASEYLWRAKVKSKALFKALLASQIIAVPLFVTMVVNFFSQRVNCTSLARFAILSNAFSMGILLTGILAVKAYRCLENSKWVLAVSVILRLCATAAVLASLPKLEISRRLTGNCQFRGNDLLFCVYVIAQLLESLFLCGCFFYATWKTRSNPIARGRLSLGIHSIDGNLNTNQDQSRGWWDHVPKQEPIAISQGTPTQERYQPTTGILSGGWNAFLGLFVVDRPSMENKCSEDTQPIQIARKPSIRGEFPLAQPPRVARLNEASVGVQQPRGQATTNSDSNPARASVPSSRFSRLIPRMVLFKKVMRDELCYTTIIAGACVFLTVLVLLGTQLPMGLQMYHWLNLNWCLISLLSVHSFGRVVRRHAKEAMLQHPSAWEYSPRSDATHIQFRQRRTWSPTMSSTTSFRRGVGTLPTTPQSEGYIGSPRRASLVRSWRASTPASLASSSPSPSLDAFSWREPSPHMPVILPSPSPNELEFHRDEGPVSHGGDGEERLIPRAM